MTTTWAADYVLRKDLGTLGVGQKGDLVVLDRDYWQVPDAEIKAVRPLMTVVDGNIRFLSAKWAPELSAEPIGFQSEAGHP
jgi:predicted amidohydrolase YtcJ